MSGWGRGCSLQSIDSVAFAMLSYQVRLKGMFFFLNPLPCMILKELLGQLSWVCQMSRMCGSWIRLLRLGPRLDYLDDLCGAPLLPKEARHRRRPVAPGAAKAAPRDVSGGPSLAAPAATRSAGGAKCRNMGGSIWSINMHMAPQNMCQIVLT